VGMEPKMELRNAMIRILMILMDVLTVRLITIILVMVVVQIFVYLNVEMDLLIWVRYVMMET
jgi:hypothetical protein